MKLSRSVSIAPDSWRFNLLEIQSPFHGLGPMAKLQKKISVAQWVLLDRGVPFWAAGRKSHIRATEWPGPGVALLLSKTSLSPPSRWEFWVFSETDSPVWLSELSPPASTGSVESYPWYSPEILWLWSQQRFFLLWSTCGIHLKPPVSKCRAVLRDSSCQPSKVGLGDFSGHWFARMKKSPCRSAGIYSRKW